MSWRHILGHEAVTAAFERAHRRSRLGHAYLFVGPSGVGKQTFARELAKVLLCDSRTKSIGAFSPLSPALRGEAEMPPSFEACDQCSSCKLVDAGTHPDLFLAGRPEESLEFGIDDIRELLEKLAMKPARGSRKIAIVDDADDLNDTAANCFLKTLEEPPPGSLLILVGGRNAERQLPTILSRCQLIRFRPLAPALVSRVLEERGIADPVRRQRLQQLAGGSPGLALSLDDDEIWAFRQQLLDTLGGGQLDPAAVARAWMRFVESAGKEAGASRHRASLVFRLLVVLLESAVKLSLNADAAGFDPAEEATLRKFGLEMGEEKLLAWIERALEADLHIDRRVQLILAIEAFLDAICRE